MLYGNCFIDQNLLSFEGFFLEPKILQLKAFLYITFICYHFEQEQNFVQSTVTKIIPLSNLLEPNIMDFTLWLDLSPNMLDSSKNLWVKDMMF